MKKIYAIRLGFILVILAAVLNGSYFWLSRVGVINTASFEALVDTKTDFKQRRMEYIKQPEPITEEVKAALRHDHLNYKKQLYDHLYSHNSVIMALKSLKYVVYVVLVTLILINYRQSYAADKFRRHIGLFAVLAMLYSAMAFMSFRMAGVIAGFNTLAFLALVFFSWISVRHRDIQYFVFLLLITLGLLLVITPIELIKGIQVFNTNSFLGKRATGFMDQPGTMGIYVVCVFSTFVVLFRSRIKPAGYLMLCAGALLLVILSGSNTASLALCLFLLAEFFQQKKSTPDKIRYWILGILALTAIILIITQGRPILDSLDGRLEKYRYYFSLDMPVLRVLFGYGIGAGSNLLLQLQSVFTIEPLVSFPVRFSIDSTPLSLVIQIGLAGCAFVYGLMIAAFFKDRRRRGLYMTFIFCSLTINIIEVFPLNILLALLLSTSLHSGLKENTDRRNDDRTMNVTTT